VRFATSGAVNQANGARMFAVMGPQPLHCEERGERGGRGSIATSDKDNVRGAFRQPLASAHFGSVWE
jgi:hypothetical protein